MKKKIVATTIIAVIVLSMFSMLPISFAATEDEIEQSIIDGLEWLAGIQNPDGSWPGNEAVAKTGLALLKFIDRAKELGENPFSEEYEYNTTVHLGLEYIFLNAHMMNISAPQPHGDPDSDGDDWGVYFVFGISHHSYTTGICLMAVGAADTCADKLGIPSPVVAFGPLAGWTYEQVIQDTVDYLAFGQNDAGWERGGWGYIHNNVGWSENSNTGWVTLGLGYALASGATIPQFVYDELEVWINYIQNPVDGDADDGGSGYSNPNDWVNTLKTGNLLYQMALLGYPVDHQNVTNAVNYQERHWNDADPDPGWKGDGLGHPHYQATFCIMKGFEAYGIKTISVGGGDLDWFDDIANLTIASQLGDGSWPSDYWGDEILATTWALLTLERVVAIPEKTPLRMKEDARELLVSHLGLYDKHIEHDIQQAIWHIDKSMNPDLWVDDSHLVWQHGNKVFDEEKLAVKELLHIVEWKKPPSDAVDMALEVIEILVESDEKLATIQYDEATVYAGASKQVDHQLALALEEFANAADKLATDKKGHPKYDDAINAYNKAWQHAGLAIQHALK